MTDELFLDFAERALTAAHQDITLLSKTSPELTAEKILHIEKRIAQARLMPTDSKMRALLIKKSLQVNQAAKAARSNYLVMKVYILKAIEQHNIELEPQILKEYKTVKNQNLLLYKYLIHIKKVLKKYQPEIIGVGCSKKEVVSFAKALNKLKEALQSLEKAKQNRKEYAKTRVIFFNELFDDIKSIVETAKFVFFRNPTRLKPYLAYGRASKRLKKDVKLQKIKKIKPKPAISP